MEARVIRTIVKNLFFCILLLAAWGCGQKGAKLQKSVVPPDQTLFDTGSEYLRKSQFIKARLAFQTLINTYPDSNLNADAYFSIADSFYDEGGTENLLQAEDQYKNFIVFFPAHPKSADAQMKIISANWKLMHAPGRDQQYTYKVEANIHKFLEQFPDSDYAPIARQYLKDVQERLAQSDFGVGQFYAERGNYAGAQSRFEEITDKYPAYSALDETYYQLAQTLEKTLKPDDAANYYSKIAAGFPFSKHFDAAKAKLLELKKPVPPVDNMLAAQNEANLKPPESWSPLKPLIMFSAAIGIKGEPDRYKLAKEMVEARKAEISSAMAAKSSEEAKPAGTATIEAIIVKNEAGNTTTSATLESGTNTPVSSTDKVTDKKKNSDKNKKKKNPS
jgi:outer membrane assembly lipoprotein YfiO